MKYSWKEKSLDKIIDFKNGKKRPPEEGCIPVYGGNGILSYTNNSNYSNCVIVGRVGAYCGSIYYEKGDCWVSDNAIVATAKEGNDIRFIYYLLISLQLNKSQIGTGQPLLTQGILNSITTIVPEYGTQKKIANVLYLIDLKIKNNNDINNNLPPHLCVARIAATQLRQTPTTNGCLHTDDKVSDRGGNDKIPQVFSSRRVA